MPGAALHVRQLMAGTYSSASFQAAAVRSGEGRTTGPAALGRPESPPKPVIQPLRWAAGKRSVLAQLVTESGPQFAAGHRVQYGAIAARCIDWC